MPFRKSLFDYLIYEPFEFTYPNGITKTISNALETEPYTMATGTATFLRTVGDWPKPVRVVFNPPATIVIWDDGTKTVVKCGVNDSYDKEKGLALCYMKKILGNTSRALNDALTVCYEEVPAPKKKKEKKSAYDISHIDADALFGADANNAVAADGEG